MRSALAAFRNRAHQEIFSSLGVPIIATGRSAAPRLGWGGWCSLEAVIDEVTTIITDPRIRYGASRPTEVNVDSAGLLEAGQTLKSVALLPAAPANEIPASDLIRQLLKPYDLAFQIREGKLTITSRKAVQRSHEHLLDELDQPVTLTWSRDDSVRDVIERLRTATRGPSDPEGLPIFGQLGGRRYPGDSWTLPEPTTKAIPIREHLRRLLEPLRLRFEIRDGAVMIGPTADEQEAE